MSALPQHGIGRLRGAMDFGDLDAVLAIEDTAYPFPWRRSHFIDSLAAGHWTRLREDADGVLVGYAVAMAAVDEMHLLNLTVAPSAEGQGHARALLDALETESLARGLRSLWLEVRPSNERARRLYTWRGFREVGLRRGYYPGPHGRREDAIVMSLALPLSAPGRCPSTTAAPAAPAAPTAPTAREDTRGSDALD
jgi:ribosomal-protein-alanine N-acetyltransferase